MYGINRKKKKKSGNNIKHKKLINIKHKKLIIY